MNDNTMLAHETSTTGTERDLREAMRVERVRKPVVAKQPFSRLTDGERHPVTVRRMQPVAAVPTGAKVTR